MKETLKYLIDHSGLTSLIALILSIYNYIYTICNQKKQNYRWELIYSANPEIKEVSMSIFKQLDQLELQNTNWGHKTTIYVKGGGAGSYYLPYYLSIIDKKTNSHIAGANQVFTLESLQMEARRLNLNASEIIYNKHFRPVFTITNWGKVQTKNLLIKIDIKFPEEEWKNIINAEKCQNLAEKQEINMICDLDLSTEIIPEIIYFKVNFMWENENKIINEKNTYLSWHSDFDRWHYEKP